eukprot:1160722-Pelagomonas_calceolata.AAC.2
MAICQITLKAAILASSRLHWFLGWNHSACAFRLQPCTPARSLTQTPPQSIAGLLSFHGSRLESLFLHAGASVMAPAQHCVSLPLSKLPQDSWADSCTCSPCWHHWYGHGVEEWVARGWLGASRGSLPPETLPPPNFPFKTRIYATQRYFTR